MMSASLCLALVGCKGTTTPGGAAPSAKKEGKVLAQVNGVTITTSDFARELENLPPYLKPVADTPEGRKELLDTLVVRELVLQQATKDGLDKSPEVAAKLEELKKRVVMEAFLRKKVDEQVKITDEELQKFYDENKEKFKSGDQIHASHILVRDEKVAQEVLKELKGGARFEDLAKKHSIDSSAAKGGDLGWFSKGSMVPEFEKAAFALPEGQTSGIVRTKFGYHIIKVTGTRKAGTRSFDEVKDQIKAALMPAKQQEVLQKLKEEIKKTAKVEIKEDALKALGTAEPEAPAGKGQAAPATPEKK